MTLLLAVSIPMIRPAFQDRYLREAARQVNAFFSSAQARAAELGRPVAVWIERVDTTPIGSRHARRLFLAEVAPSFTGATLNSRATVSSTGIIAFNAADQQILSTLLVLNERFTIRFDHKGFLYHGKRSGPTTWEILIPLGIPPGADASVNPAGVTYELTRGPTRSAAAPLVLPADSVLDLSVSGMGPKGWQFDSATAGDLPVIVSFAPSGRVEYVYAAGIAERPSAPIHFLIGRRARVVNPTPASVASPITANLADPTCLWITISERTGTAITSDNADTSQLLQTTSVADRIGAAREFARRSAQKGGR
jgi:hypothetical protein